MPAASSLAALMKEWPLNSAMLSTATHSKLREGLDGTDTQVVTCTINRWTTKMKGGNEYITREISRIGDGNSEDTRKLYWWSIRGGEAELILGRGPRMNFDPPPNYDVDDPVPQRSCQTVDEVLTKAQFLSPLLYRIHCIGPVEFRFAHIYSERHPPNRNPIIILWNRSISNGDDYLEGVVFWKLLFQSTLVHSVYFGSL